MPQSVEQRIYGASPTTPNPAELKDAMKLLLDTHGKELSIMKGVTTQKLNVGYDVLKDETTKTVFRFRTDFDPNNEDGERCIGFDIYTRTFFPRTTEQSSYKRIHAIEVHHDAFGNLVAVDHEKENPNKNLSEDERRVMGAVILWTREQANKNSLTPSKRLGTLPWE